MRFQDRREKDLFEQVKAADAKIGRKTRFLLPRVKKSISLSYENIIFLAIAFIMTSIIFFSLGVEKGRRDVGHVKTENRERITGNRERITENRGQDSKQKIQDKYIIQLAAFKKKQSAEQEVSRLRTDGYEADIKESGSYYQVYIGGFVEKKDAQGLLEKLKKKYEDCYIKTLSEDITYGGRRPR